MRLHLTMMGMLALSPVLQGCLDDPDRDDPDVIITGEGVDAGEAEDPADLEPPVNGTDPDPSDEVSDAGAEDPDAGAAEGTPDAGA